MTVTFRLSARAQRDLRHMAPADQRRILAGLQRLAETGHGDITALRGEWKGSFRPRIGKWRAFFRQVAPGVCEVYRIDNRGEAY